MLVEVYAEHPEPRKIKRAADAVAAGHIIAYPTDTVYALGCDPFNKKAVDQLYELRRLPRTQHLALICADLSDLSRFAVVDNAQYHTLKRLVPGPYCFILPATREVPKMLHSDRRTIGIRVPNHAVPLALVRQLGHPLITTGAHLHNEEPLVDPREIQVRFSRVDIVLDAGMGETSPSTVLDLSGEETVLVRQGAGVIDGLL